MKLFNLPIVPPKTHQPKVLKHKKKSKTPKNDSINVVEIDSINDPFEADHIKAYENTVLFKKDNKSKDKMVK